MWHKPKSLIDSKNFSKLRIIKFINKSPQCDRDKHKLVGLYTKRAVALSI